MQRNRCPKIESIICVILHGKCKCMMHTQPTSQSVCTWPGIPELKSQGGIPLSKALSFSLPPPTQLQMSGEVPCVTLTPCPRGLSTPKSLYVIKTWISS